MTSVATLSPGMTKGMTLYDDRYPLGPGSPRSNTPKKPNKSRTLMTSLKHPLDLVIQTLRDVISTLYPDDVTMTS